MEKRGRTNLLNDQATKAMADEDYRTGFTVLESLRVRTRTLRGLGSYLLSLQRSCCATAVLRQVEVAG
jgi:hypothetical protein